MTSLTAHTSSTVLPPTLSAELPTVLSTVLPTTASTAASTAEDGAKAYLRAIGVSALMSAVGAVALRLTVLAADRTPLVGLRDRIVPFFRDLGPDIPRSKIPLLLGLIDRSFLLLGRLAVSWTVLTRLPLPTSVTTPLLSPPDSTLDFTVSPLPLSISISIPASFSAVPPATSTDVLRTVRTACTVRTVRQPIGLRDRDRDLPVLKPRDGGPLDFKTLRGLPDVPVGALCGVRDVPLTARMGLVDLLSCTPPATTTPAPAFTPAPVAVAVTLPLSLPLLGLTDRDGLRDLLRISLPFLAECTGIAFVLEE